MGAQFLKIRRLAFCLAVSLLLHLVIITVVRMFAPREYGEAVTLPREVMVELADVRLNHRRLTASARAGDTVSGTDLHNPSAPRGVLDGSAGLRDARSLAGPKETRLPVVAAESGDAAEASGDVNNNDSVAVPERVLMPLHASPRLKSSSFLNSTYEKLTYVVSMAGVPVGNAELKAVLEDGQVTISFRIRSNELFSALYPVDNLVETRHVDGRYIMTRIRQREGTFSNDATFTVNLLKKRISWTEPVNGNSRQMIVAADDLLDTLSGIYYLRNRHLLVGQSELLHIFDGQAYADVPVEILRREEIRLPDMSAVDTLAVRPVVKATGMFQHSGDMTIWLTDDTFRVPVKIVTTIPLGAVTAELVAAESQ